MPSFFPCFSRRAFTRSPSRKRTKSSSSSSSAAAARADAQRASSSPHQTASAARTQSVSSSSASSSTHHPRKKARDASSPPSSSPPADPSRLASPGGGGGSSEKRLDAMAEPSARAEADACSVSPRGGGAGGCGELQGPSLSASFARLASQGGTALSSLPSLQRQQTEQLVKSLDFYVYVWGLNDKGQLLNGAFGSSAAGPAQAGRSQPLAPLTSGPSRVNKLQHRTIAGMSCSAAHTFIWDFHDLLWAGGSTDIGLRTLGIDLDDDDALDTGVVPRASLCETLGDVVTVASSNTHAVAVLENGAAISFGSNEFGQLAHGPGEVQLAVSRPRLMLVQPEAACARHGQVSFSNASCGENFSVLLSATGVVFTCGDNSQGCLGLGAPPASPSPSAAPPPASSAAASSSSAASSSAPSSPSSSAAFPASASSASSASASCSSSSSGSAGVASAASLVLVPSLYAVPVRQVAAGAQHVVALTISGEVFTWGRNKDGRLGLGAAFAAARVVPTPTKVKQFEALGVRVKFVAAGFSHTGVILAGGGRAMLCGSNFYGELGRDPYFEDAPPAPAALAGSGQCGDAKAGAASAPRKPRAPEDVLLSSSTFLPLRALAKHRLKFLSLGQHFSAAVTSTGKLFCWGKNDLQQLGVPQASSFVHLSPACTAPACDLGDAGDAAGRSTVEEHPKREADDAAAVAAAPSPAASTRPVRPTLHPSAPYSAAPIPFQSADDLFFYFVACGDWHCGAAAVPASVAAAAKRGGKKAEAGSSALCARSPSGMSPDVQGFFKSIFRRSQSLIGCEFPPCSRSSSLWNAGLSHAPSCSPFTLTSRSSLVFPAGQKTPQGSDADETGGSPGAAAQQLESTLFKSLSSSASASSFGDSAPAASSSYLAGVSVEEMLMHIEGAASTGDNSLLKSKLALVFSDVYRLNCSFVYPGRGCRPDFAGLDEVYAHLPQSLLPTVASSAMLCLSSSVKYAKYLTSTDAVRFALFILACFPLYGQDIDRMEVDETDFAAATRAADDGDDAAGGLAPPPAPADAPAAPTNQGDSPRADRAPAAEAAEPATEAETAGDKEEPTVPAAAGSDTSRGEAVFTALVHLLFHLSPEGKMAFVCLAAEVPDLLFEMRLVRMTKWFIIKTLRQAGASYRNIDRLWQAVALLELLYLANMRPASHRAYALPPALGEEARGDGSLKIPVEKFHVAAIAQLVDPIREVAFYSDLIQHTPFSFGDGRDASRAGGLQAAATPAPSPASACSATPRESSRVEQVEGAEEEPEAREAGGGPTAAEEAAGARQGGDAAPAPSSRWSEETGETREKQNATIASEPQKAPMRARWSAFDVYQDIVNSSELQRRWCFFMAHMHLCPLKFKRNVIVVANIFRQHQTGLQSLLEAQLPFLLLRVHRGALVDDAVAALQKAEPRHLLRPLKIVFEGEEGVDEGGLKREFFSLLTPELLSSERRLFTYNPSARTYWFANLAPEELAEKKKYYWLIGALASMAIYNDIVMPLAFPLVLYNRLQGGSVALEDLADVYPEEMNSFEKMLTMDKPDEFEAAFSTQTFAVDLVRDGKLVGEVPLMEGGETTPVTMQNRALFVAKYTNYLLVDAVKQQYDAFEQGFLLCATPLISQLSGRELQLLICGTPELNFTQLRESAKLEGYEAGDPYLDSFWEILLSFDLFQKQKFLKFVTGSDRSPAFGLKEIRMTIQRNGGEPTERLPTAYTCFHVLLLPRYESKDKLQRLLLRAIDESEGFGMQ
ncbi:HECT-domain (ubiquitin-transferase) domain-containing protein [Besnoitia besnoiti]|uniref:HECT-domain (Ubiquitin-transferase) domain-containing protein n=1 Tax=Besnoitia besnoiti TaxID=94643 RepID=A0A2A9MIF8_BESBE|nr:HECT-domain (ubiquitin-transferase) domain-containing protein [Besnoitia besnoiti]PFH35367.1 HECT-domain (ubiquitin-transferase) domain-containing protein [Besnoitia besnoiti]